MQLYFRKAGKGATLIILHGVFGMSDNWYSLSKQFAKDFTAYTPDLRNHGQSPHDDEMNYDVMVQDIIRLMADQQIPKANFIGHSMGGKIAMKLAQENPEKVERLVVVDMTPGEMDPGHWRVIDALQAVDFNRVKSRRDIKILLKEYFKDPMTIQFLLKNVKRTGQLTFQWKFNLQAIANHLPELYKGLDASKKFNGPVLVIKGGKSDYIREEDERLFREIFPHSEIKTIPEAGHWVHADAPETFYQITVRFLKHS